MKQVMEIKNVIMDSKKNCPFCGKEKTPMTLDFGGIQRTVWPICKCEDEAYRKQQEEDKQRDRLVRLEALFKQSRLGERFKKCTFENFIKRVGTQQAYDITKDYVENFNIYKRDGKGLLLSSIPGTGKTHLCGAITNKLLGNMTSVVFVVVPELLQKIRNTYGHGTETEAQIMYGLTECDLLILDDVGAEKKSDWTTEKLFTVIDSRYRNNQPIIFTTNCGSQELKVRIGIRTFSRIMEVCTPVTMTCDDYRLRDF